MSYNFTGGYSIPGFGQLVTPPAASSFTIQTNSSWINGTPTVSDASGVLTMTVPDSTGGSYGANTNTTVFYRPKSGPKTITMLSRLSGYKYASSSSVTVGPAMGESATGRWMIGVTWGPLSGSAAFNFYQVTAPATGGYGYGATAMAVTMTDGMIWQRMQDDGVNITYSWSPNGLTWITYSNANNPYPRSSWLTGTVDRMGISVNGSTGIGIAEILSYQES